MTIQKLATIAGLTVLFTVSAPWLATRILDFRCWHRYGGESRFAGLEQYYAYRAICTQPYPNRF